MDVIKVRLQIQNQLAKVKGFHGHHAGEYKGFVHAFGKILREEGFGRGLMKGWVVEASWQLIGWINIQHKARFVYTQHHRFNAARSIILEHSSGFVWSSQDADCSQRKGSVKVLSSWSTSCPKSSNISFSFNRQGWIHIVAKNRCWRSQWCGRICHCKS